LIAEAALDVATLILKDKKKAAPAPTQKETEAQPEAPKA